MLQRISSCRTGMEQRAIRKQKILQKNRVYLVKFMLNSNRIMRLHQFSFIISTNLINFTILYFICLRAYSVSDHSVSISVIKLVQKNKAKHFLNLLCSIFNVNVIVQSRLLVFLTSAPRTRFEYKFEYSVFEQVRVFWNSNLILSRSNSAKILRFSSFGLQKY